MSNVSERFVETFGYQPTGVWRAPGRVNLIGEHTDYNMGFVLPFAIEYNTQVAIGKRPDTRARFATSLGENTNEYHLVEVEDVTAFSPQDSLGEAQDEAGAWARYPMGVWWAMREAGILAEGVDMFVDSTVPVGAGLSSSHALECASALGANDLFGGNLDDEDGRRVLAKIVQRAENEVVGAPTGIMDQSASMLSRKDHALFLDCRSLESEAVPLDLVGNNVGILVIDTRVSHALVDGGYASRRQACEAGAAIMGVEALRDVSVADLPRAQKMMDELTFRRVRHVVSENQRVLDTVQALRTNGPRAIGEFLNASHESMRDNFEISTPELDLAVATAQQAGALGARMTGGGFGGSAIALINLDTEEQVRQAVLDAFAAAGYREPGLFMVRPAQGASRIQ